MVRGLACCNSSRCFIASRTAEGLLYRVASLLMQRALHAPYHTPHRCISAERYAAKRGGQRRAGWRKGGLSCCLTPGDLGAALVDRWGAKGRLLGELCPIHGQWLSRFPINPRSKYGGESWRGVPSSDLD